MKIHSLLFAFACACISSSALAHCYYDELHSVRHDRYERHGGVQRCDYSRPWVHERNHRAHHRPGGAGPCHDIHRGERLPRYYWSERYHVGDWRHHGLPRPWHGHHWVRVGFDYVLVSRETGRIEKVILLRHRR